MKVTRTVAVILAVAVAAPTWAEQASRRGASSSKSSNSDEKKSGGDSRPATSSSDHSSKRSGSGSDSRPSRPSSSGGTSVYVPSAPSRPLTDAERRHPRPGTGQAYDGRGGHYDGRGRGRVLVGHYGPHYHGRSYFAHSCYDHRTTFIYYDTPYYRHVYHYYDRDGAIRVLVDPAEAKVFVDGYYAGEADDFDGIFQRLYVSPGRHDITLKLEGYRTQRFRVYVPRGRTLKLHHDMVSGDGEVVADLTTDEDAGEETAGADDDGPAPEESDERGTIVLNVTPEDASVYVDGEFHGTGRNSESLILPAGRHQIEVVRPGFKTYEREVDVRPGRTLELEVDLRRS